MGREALKKGRKIKGGKEITRERLGERSRETAQVERKWKKIRVFVTRKKKRLPGTQPADQERAIWSSDIAAGENGTAVKKGGNGDPAKEDPGD